MWHQPTSMSGIELCAKLNSFVSICLFLKSKINLLLCIFLKRHMLCKLPPGDSSKARPHLKPVLHHPGRGDGVGLPLLEHKSARVPGSPTLAWKTQARETLVQMHSCRQLNVGCPRLWEAFAACGELWAS